MTKTPAGKARQTPLVSIFMPTYNHAPYIEQAMESILSQETGFPFELVVCDDASTDGTAEIVQRWAEKHENLVCLLQPVNSRGNNNFYDGLNHIRSKYIAFCEGDDYWSVPHKLEKQIRFLEDNPDFSVCCHKVEMQFDKRPGDERKQYIYKSLTADDERIRQGIFYADEAIANYYFQTSSVVFRWRFHQGLPPWFRRWMMYDHAMLMLHAVEGKIKYFDEAMSVWRRNETGYSWLQTIDKTIFFRKQGHDWIFNYTEMDKFFAGRFHLQIRERVLLALRNMIAGCRETGDLESAREIILKYQNWCLAPAKDNSDLFDAIRQVFPERDGRVLPWAGKPGEDTREPAPTLGGFKGLDIDLIPETPDSVWAAWTQGQEYACFASPEAALCAWLYHKRVRLLWLPAITPRHVLDELRRTVALQFYPVGMPFSPAADFIEQTQPGDAILTASWAGRPPSPDMRRALVQRQGVFWIDDRSMALWPGTPYEADVTLYSPSSVLGVPDGGVLVGQGCASLQPDSSGGNTLAPSRRDLLLERYEHPAAGSDLLIREQAIHLENLLSGGAMSRLTLSLLTRIPMGPTAARCRENWRVLHGLLKAHALWPDCPEVDFAPGFFPVVMPASIPQAFFTAGLSRKGIFCQPLQIPAYENEFWESKQLRRLLLLPCDHRYEEGDMQKIASEFLKIARGESDLGVSGKYPSPI
jgi:glycosyltransferase involved in cell wall biosynthesis